MVKIILFCLWIDIFLLAIFEGKSFALLNNYKKKYFWKNTKFLLSGRIELYYIVSFGGKSSFQNDERIKTSD